VLKEHGGFEQFFELGTVKDHGQLGLILQRRQGNGTFVMANQAEVIAKTVHGMFEAATRRGTGIGGNSSKILVDLVVADLFGEFAEVERYDGNTPDVVVKGTAALSPERYLLLQFKVHGIETGDGFNGFFDNCRF